MDQSQRTEQAGFDELNSQIALLNVQYADQFLPETRRGGFWRKLGIFFACDAGGAAIGASFGGVGAIIGGIWGSMMALLTLNSIEDVDIAPIIDLKTIADIHNLDSTFDRADSVGYFHNKIIAEILHEQGDMIYSLSAVELKTAILSRVETYFGPITLSAKNRGMLCFRADKTTKAFCDPAEQNPFGVLEKTLPGREAEVKIIKSFCENLSQLPEDQQSVVAYTTDFQNLVEKSNVSEFSKTLIRTGVSVAGNSNLLWGQVAR